MSPTAAARDAKIVLAVVIALIVAAVLVLSLTGHAVPDSVTAALVAAVGTLGGVSVPIGTTAAVQAAETDLSKLLPADDLAGLRKDVNDALTAARADLPADALSTLLGRVSKLEAAATTSVPSAHVPAAEPTPATPADPGPATQPIPTIAAGAVPLPPVAP